jgi:hypothetical protein
MGAAMNSVSPAFAAVPRGRFDELAPVLPAEIGWRGIAGPDGETPSFRGHETALAVMRRGPAAQG